MRMFGKRPEEDIFAEQDGYMTVEASLLMPMVLCVLVFVLYLSFYLYDRCTLEQDAYLHAYQKSIERGHTERREGSLSEIRRSTFLLSEQEEKLEQGGTVRCTVRARLGASVFRGALFMPDIWEIAVCEQARTTDPPASFRRARRLAALARMLRDR